LDEGQEIDVFDKASKIHLVAFKGNKEELEKILRKIRIARITWTNREIEQKTTNQVF
jgi:hypothetical protein